MKYLIVALALSLAACNVTAKMDADPQEPFSIPDLAGNWKSNCAPGSSAGTWETQTLDFTATTFAAGVALFSDPGCTHALGSAVHTIQGTYAITGEDQFLAGGFDLTLVYTDTNGTQRTGYQLGQMDNGKLYMGAYIGLNPQSRPAMVDRSFGFERH